jgi:LPXTG-motif cell wall-anchored protein
MEYECFGIPGGGAVVGITIGIIILLAGIIYFMQQANLISSNINVWPFAIIIFGILLIIGALFALRRRR